MSECLRCMNKWTCLECLKTLCRCSVNFDASLVFYSSSLMDSGLVIVTFITFVYIVIMFTLLFYVKYEWCDLLFKNNTVSLQRHQYVSIFAKPTKNFYLSMFSFMPWLSEYVQSKANFAKFWHFIDVRWKTIFTLYFK